jgi:hypothetical protein
MLHEMIHLLHPEQRYRHAMLLAHFASISGGITHEEMSFFEERLGAAMLSPERREQLRGYLIEPPSLETCLDGLNARTGKLALRDACLMSLADRDIDADERAMLEQLAESVNVDKGAIDEVIEWAVNGFHWIQSGYDILELE